MFIPGPSIMPVNLPGSYINNIVKIEISFTCSGCDSPREVEIILKGCVHCKNNVFYILYFSIAMFFNGVYFVIC